MRVLVTRARDDALRTAATLRRMGHDPVLAPVLELRATGCPVPEGDWTALLATSAHAFPPVGPHLPQALRALPLFAVGTATAQAAREAGHATVVVGPGRAQDLAAALPASWPAGSRLLYLAGRDRGPDLEQALAARGLDVLAVAVYEAVAATALADEARHALGDGGPLAVLHYSARSATILLRLALAAGLREAVARATHACLSQAVAEPLFAAGLAPLVATKPQEDALMRLLPPA
jgi:uroporphyrinogen-III synthase